MINVEYRESIYPWKLFLKKSCTLPKKKLNERIKNAKKEALWIFLKKSQLTPTNTIAAIKYVPARSNESFTGITL